MNKKCSSCGFINFVDAENCKKCEAELPAPDAVQNPNSIGYTIAIEPSGTYAPTVRKGSFPVKTVVFVLVGFVVLSTVAGLKLSSSLLRLADVKWREYHPEGLDMTVMMPNEPTKLEPVTTPLAIGSMTNHAFVSGVPGQGEAMFLVIDYTGDSDLFKPQLTSQLLDAELTAFMQRTSSIPISKNYVPFSGLVALDFVTQPPSRESARVYGRMFVVKTRLYIFTITAKEGSELFDGKDKFLKPSVRTT